ncbi:MAG TPA: hypothetical protein HPP54_10790 [Nitrospinae bacterium]|nr:hypothetical protein [Nitrospinota bacterium]
MDYGIMPLWELRETLSAFWRDGDFGEDFRQAYYVWEIRTGSDFLVGDLTNKGSDMQITRIPRWLPSQEKANKRNTKKARRQNGRKLCEIGS